jgi:DNA-binding response OmpR family regulator
MPDSNLEGHSILIVEDELLVAMDIVDAFESVGAVTAMATTLQQALILVEGEDLKAAVVDHILGPEDSSPLCARLNERALPFLIYTGLGKVTGSCAVGLKVMKPESPAVLVSMVEALLRDHNLRSDGWN